MNKKRRDSDPNKRSAPDAGAPLQRYRGVLIGALAVVAVGIVGFFVLQSATASAYACDSLLTSPPLESSADGVERLGFIVPDVGRAHSSGRVRYATCPPTSGDHRAAGALDRRFYGPGSIQVPNDWVHNLEHGYAVIAYAGDPGAETVREIRAAMDAPAPTDVAVGCGLPNKVIALRFDDMSEPFAVLAWDRALLMETFDAELASAAAEEFQDQPQAPERAC